LHEQQKKKKVSFKNLPFNPRWKIDYFLETIENTEPIELKPVHNENETMNNPIDNNVNFFF